MTRHIDPRGTVGVQKLLLAAGTTLFLGGLLVVAGIGGAGVGDLGSDPAATDTPSHVGTDTPNQPRTATPSEPGDTRVETEPASLTGDGTLTLNGATKLELTGETIRTAVTVAGPLRKSLHVTGRTVVEGRLGLSDVVAGVKIEDNARVTGRVEVDRIGDGAGVSLTDGARVGAISVGTVTDGDIEVEDNTTVEGGITVEAIESDGEVSLDGTTTVGDDVRIGQVDGTVELEDDTVVEGNLLIDRVGSDGEVTIKKNVMVRGDVIVRNVAGDGKIKIDRDAVAGAIVIDGYQESAEGEDSSGGDRPGYK